MGFIMNQAHAGDWKINRGEITIEGRDDLTYVWSLDQYPIRTANVMKIKKKGVLK